MAKFVRLTVDTQETLTPAQKSELFDLYEKVGYLFFLDKPNTTIKTDDLPEIHLEEGEKSPSQRLKSVIYVYGRDVRKIPESDKAAHRAWYENEIERIINAYKRRLL
jgi:hypothetical protein